MMFAVTGATGHIGGKVAARIASLGLPQRLIVRDPSRAPKLPGADICQVSSYGDPTAMGKALSGVQTMFLVSAREIMGVIKESKDHNTSMPYYDRLHQHICAVSAAAAVGVRHVIYLSFLNAAPDATFVLAREHFRTEEFVRSTGVAFTFLRQGLYMDNVPQHIMSDDVIRAPAGQGRVSWITRDDIADCVVAVMTGHGHDGQIYDLTGPEALSMEETAERLSAVIGRKISYEALTPHEARVNRNMSRMIDHEILRQSIAGTGITEPELEGWVSHYLQIATGEAGPVADSVPRLTGHPAQSLAEYLEKHPETYAHFLKES
ncbi:MAG TPA: SDR family oxidoreductase [Syntrophorhabdaceae bacterium]|nr:SDR family oxidoreductase [Syntrophorhabdaceae bacterium]